MGRTSNDSGGREVYGRKEQTKVVECVMLQVKSKQAQTPIVLYPHLPRSKALGHFAEGQLQAPLGLIPDLIPDLGGEELRTWALKWYKKSCQSTHDDRADENLHPPYQTPTFHTALTDYNR